MKRSTTLTPRGYIFIEDLEGQLGPAVDVPPPTPRHWKSALVGAICLLALSAAGLFWMWGAWRYLEGRGG